MNFGSFTVAPAQFPPDKVLPWRPAGVAERRNEQMLSYLLGRRAAAYLIRGRPGCGRAFLPIKPPAALQ